MGASNPWPLPFALDDAEERATWTGIAIRHGAVFHPADGQIGLQVVGSPHEVACFADRVGSGHVVARARTVRWEARGQVLVGTIARAMWDLLTEVASPLREPLAGVAWPAGLVLCPAPGCPARAPSRMRCCALHARLLTRSESIHPAMKEDRYPWRPCWCGEPLSETAERGRRGLCATCQGILRVTVPLARDQRRGWPAATWRQHWSTLAVPQRPTASKPSFRPAVQSSIPSIRTGPQ
jgi:hypothetical protein